MAFDTQQCNKFMWTCKEVCCEERTGDKGIDLPSRMFPAEIKMLETPETEEVDFRRGKAVLREVPQRKEKGARKLKAQEHIIVGWNFWVGEWLKQLLELKTVPGCYLTFPSPAERWVSWYFTSQFYFLPYNNCCWHIFFSIFFLDTLYWVPSGWWHYLVLSQIFHPSPDSEASSCLLCPYSHTLVTSMYLNHWRTRVTFQKPVLGTF